MLLFALSCAIGLAIATAAVSAYVVWRTRAEADERVADAVQQLASGMQETMRSLAAAVETAQAEARPERLVTELAASLDLEEVSERTLEAAAGVPGVEAALLEAEATGGARISAAVGLPADEAAKAAVQLPENDNLRAIEITYRYRIDDVEGSSQARRPKRRRAAGARRRHPGRDAERLQPRAGRRARRAAARGARAARRARRPRARERAQVHGGAGARRPRRADGPAQPALLPRDTRARGRRAPTATAGGCR